MSIKTDGGDEKYAHEQKMFKLLVYNLYVLIIYCTFISYDIFGQDIALFLLH